MEVYVIVEHPFNTNSEPVEVCKSEEKAQERIEEVEEEDDRTEYEIREFKVKG